MGNGMNKVLHGLYVGNFRDAKDEEQLNQNNITHILSIHDTAKELLKDKKYLCILASDCAQQDLTCYFPECIDFIHKARLGNGGVLVHCLAGVSRSVTITAAYIMTVTNFGWRDTIQAIRGARNCANPNFGFQRQLQDYENDGLEKARQKIKSDYPPNPFSDNADCDALLKSYRKFMMLGESDSYDGLFMLPPKAYGNRNKRTTENDDEKDEVENSDNKSVNHVQSGNTEDSDKDHDSDKDRVECSAKGNESSAKGNELVEREKWEVTAVPIAQEESSELENTS